jgi:hypothetical protein
MKQKILQRLIWGSDIIRFRSDQEMSRKHLSRKKKDYMSGWSFLLDCQIHEGISWLRPSLLS